MVKKLGLNAAFAAGANLSGLRYDPYMAYNFVIEIDGLLTGNFSEVTGLESEIQTEEYQEGGVNEYTYKFPTRVVYPPLILNHGVTDIDTLWNWYQSGVDGKIKFKNGTIMLLDRKRLPVMWWNFKNAYPVKWSGPQFNAANDSQVAIERVELVHQGISKSAIARGFAAARAGAQIAGL
ncbi:phage tail protein [Anabaena sp. UHCC 0399]|uniref:phage tail protein n=1 Tax=Anabaena sp. UHCC 0399 TaxID=3110238 RepID=UPI002B1F0439|nr:phage tail protein [Anabaena sp. UHCC 0399]MEA5567777.1 phage tail protein [Anabaena sp. UHCC 0399]